MGSLLSFLIKYNDNNIPNIIFSYLNFQDCYSLSIITSYINNYCLINYNSLFIEKYKQFDIDVMEKINKMDLPIVTSLDHNPMNILSKFHLESLSDITITDLKSPEISKLVFKDANDEMELFFKENKNKKQNKPGLGYINQNIKQKNKEMTINFVKPIGIKFSEKNESGVAYIGTKKPYMIDPKTEYTTGYYIAKTWCKDDIEKFARIEKDLFIKKQIINITNTYILSFYANYYSSRIKDDIKYYNFFKKRLIEIINNMKIEYEKLKIDDKKEKDYYIKTIVDEHTNSFLKKIINIIFKFCDGLMTKSEIEKCDDLLKYYSILNCTSITEKIEVARKYYKKIKEKYQIKLKNIPSIVKNQSTFLDIAPDRYNYIKNWVIENNSTKWFGFNVNKSFRLLYFSLNIDIKYLTYHDEMLTNYEKKEMILVLLNICKMTGSKQLIYYLNKWSPGIKSKGFKEFDRTFGYWFDFKNEFLENINIFMDSTKYLTTLLKMNNLFMKNLNNYVKIKDLINNYSPIEKKEIVINDPIIIDTNTFPEVNIINYTKNISYYKFINDKLNINITENYKIPIYDEKKFFEKVELNKSNNNFKYFENKEKDIQNINKIILEKSSLISNNSKNIAENDDNTINNNDLVLETMKEYLDRIKKGTINDNKIVLKIEK
jgi:hypothetical protein